MIAEIESPIPTEVDETDTPVGGVNLPITRLLVPSIGLNTSVIEVGWHQITQDGVPKNVWQVADYAAGWHNNSKKPGQGGNVVLSGHHNINGQVFRYLVNLNKGDLITVYQDNKPSYYAVTDKLTLKDKGEPPEVRRENARWIGPVDEERLTLVTCWPYNSNTHRLVVIAKPTDPPAEPLALDPLSIEQRPSAIAMDTVPKPVSNLAVPAAVMPSNQANPNTITRLVAESINLDTPVLEEDWKVVERAGKPTKLWNIPENAAGWHQDSKLPGQGGNIVLSGFHNIKGEVFRYIVDLKPGDFLTLYMGDESYRYKVVDRLILKEKGEPPEVRQQNARWIGQVNEERLTLVTGWPYTGNTHRVVVIARPILEN